MAREADLFHLHPGYADFLLKRSPLSGQGICRHKQVEGGKGIEEAGMLRLALVGTSHAGGGEDQRAVSKETAVCQAD